MTNFRFKRLEKYSYRHNAGEHNYKFELPQSDSGKNLMSCREPGCTTKKFFLKVNAGKAGLEITSLMKRSPGTPGMTCPYCGHDDDDQNFISEDDINHTIKKVEKIVVADISDMFGDMLKKSFRGSKYITVKSSPRREPVLPVAIREDLLRNMACGTCEREYGVFAIGLFCPDCGSLNLKDHWNVEHDLIEKQILLAEDIEEEFGRELSFRLLGNAHEDVVTAFETYLKTVYRFLLIKAGRESELKGIGNSFQNTEKTRKLYTNFSYDPLMILNEEEITRLILLLEKRHVIGHNLSVADEGYLRKSGDDESVGQTVTILAEEIQEFLALTGKVVSELEVFLGQKYFTELNG